MSTVPITRNHLTPTAKWSVPVILASLIASAPSMAASDFYARLLTKPTISTPANDNAFVKIFVRAGDNQSYAFITDGSTQPTTNMTYSEWLGAFSRMGWYVHPWAAYYQGSFTPGGEDIPMDAALASGHAIAGEVPVLPTTTTDKQALTTAYSDIHGKQMTYFFHDVETPSMGISGGEGSKRIHLNLPEVGKNYLLYAANSSDGVFNTQVGGSLQEFDVKFGAEIFNATLGGGDAPLVKSGDTTNGWMIQVVNNAFGGDPTDGAHIEFRSYANGAVDKTYSPLLGTTVRGFRDIAVQVRNGSSASTVKVTISVQGVGSTTNEIARPTWSSNSPYGFGIGGYTFSAARQLDIDDLYLQRYSNGATSILARYTFEDNTLTVDSNGDITSIGDAYGGDLALNQILMTTPVTGVLTTAPTAGLPANTEAAFKTWLVDAPSTTHDSTSVGPIQLITNYEMSGGADDISHWKSLGFTHGNTQAYVRVPINPDTASGSALVATLLKRSEYAVKYAWLAGSDWHSMWLGNESVPAPAQTLSPDDYKSLLTMTVLQGNRWFILLPGMSGGHFGSNTCVTATCQANINADALYALAQAASRFQSTWFTNQDLQDSIRLTKLQGLVGSGAPSTLTAMARRNPANGKTWFAGFATNYSANNQTVNATVTLGKPGTVYDLTTSGSTAITTAPYTFTTSFNGFAKPFLFVPSQWP